MYGDASPSTSTVKKLVFEFKRARERVHVENTKCSTAPKITEKLQDMILIDRRKKVREIANTVGMSNELVGYILNDQMGSAHAHSK